MSEKDMYWLEPKLVEVETLVDKFGSQSEQINKAKTDLENALEKISNVKDLAEAEFKKSEKWHEKSIDKLDDMCYKFDESFEALENAFNEENFKALCEKIADLAKVLNECNALKDELTDIKSSIIEAFNERIENEISSLRTEVEANRALLLTIRDEQAANRESVENKLQEIIELFK